VIVTHFEVSDVSTTEATLDTSAITRLMFDLCSAPCKALRFAPPARARRPAGLDGACAQITSWLLRDGRR
jgi:hypothetical protein